MAGALGSPAAAASLSSIPHEILPSAVFVLPSCSHPIALATVAALSLSSAHAGVPQAIDFPALPDRLGNEAPFSVAASASSGLPVSFSIVSPAGVASLSGNQVALSGAGGSVTVRASQPGDATYDPAPDVFRTFAVGESGQRFEKIFGGAVAEHVAGVRADGSLWLWGRNAHGQLGDGTFIDRFTPVPVGGGAQWLQVSCGARHTAAIRADGTLWLWGDNLSGQLGTGTTVSSSTPTQLGTATTWTSVACGAAHTVARRADGTLWTWGDNTYAQLGLGHTLSRSTPAKVGIASTWTAVACGENHNAALRADGTLWAWGENAAWQLGVPIGPGAASPVQVGTTTTWTSVACGRRHTVARQSDGSLWGWGDDAYGQLGRGDRLSRRLPAPVPGTGTWTAVTAGNRHTLGLAQDGSVWAWGGNSHGQIGDGTTVDRLVPLQVSTESHWAALAATSLHSVALRTNGMLWSWGAGTAGQLGNHDTADSALPRRTWPLRQSQTITLSISAGPHLARTNVPISASAGSGLPVQLATHPPAALSGNSVRLDAPGDIEISADQPGDDAWLPAPTVSSTLSILADLNLASAWRQTHFGHSDATGSAADNADPDRDGLVNIVEFAMGTLPRTATPAPSLQRTDTTLTLDFTRNGLAAAAGVTVAAEWADTLAAGSWTTQGITETLVGTAGDDVQILRVTIPLPGPARRFFRLRIDTPP